MRDVHDIPLSELKRNHGGSYFFIKKNVLCGYTNDLLTTYLNDYLTSITHFVDFLPLIEDAVKLYDTFENGTFSVFFMTNSHHLTPERISRIDVNNFSCYSDAYRHIDKLLNIKDEHLKRLFVVSYKMDNEVLTNIHDNIRQMIPVDNIWYKSLNFGLKLWLHIPRKVLYDDMNHSFDKLHEVDGVRVVKRPKFNEVCIQIDDYQTFIRMKLVNQWLFPYINKVDYGMKLVDELLKEHYDN